MKPLRRTPRIGDPISLVGGGHFRCSEFCSLSAGSAGKSDAGHARGRDSRRGLGRRGVDPGGRRG